MYTVAVVFWGDNVNTDGRVLFLEFWDVLGLHWEVDVVEV